MDNLRSYARLTFVTKTKGTLVMDSSVNDCILSVTTNKEMSNPNGTFTILLSPRIAKQLALDRGSLLISDILKPFDIVQIEFKVNANGYKTEMIGLVSRAAVTLSIGADGAPQRVIKIDGFDMGVALKNFKIYFNPYVATANRQELGGYVYFGTNKTIFNGQNPADFIRLFLQYAFSNAVAGQPFYTFTLPTGKGLPSYIDFFSMISTIFTNHTMADPFFLTSIGPSQEVSVYDMVKFYSDIPYHEVFLDLRRPTITNGTTTAEAVAAAEATHLINPSASTPLSGVANANASFNQPYVLNMRTAPFSDGPTGWYGLNTHDFITSDIVAQDVAISEDNVFNYYEVICSRQNAIVGDLQKAFLAETAGADGIPRFPIIDQDSLNTFGLKKFPYNETKYVEFVTSPNNTTTAPATNSSSAGLSTNDIFKQTLTLARQLLRWFAFGEYFETGVIVLKGRVGVGPDGITMGSRLREKTPSGALTGKEFYIESVMQEFVLGSSLRTSISVTRGHYPSDWTDSLGNFQLGRFSKVIKLEQELHLDQFTNNQFFNPTDPEDSGVPLVAV